MARRRDWNMTWVAEFNRLLSETIALGVEPDRALKYWAWAVEHEVRKDEREERRRLHDA